MSLFIWFLILLPFTLQDEIILPETLTLETFKQQLSTQKLSFVEFYSPYCHHCKTFEPIWKSTYNNNKDWLIDHKIGFYQVNCVENGDLCVQEKIKGYPSMKLYSNKAMFTKDYNKDYNRNEKDIMKFLKEESIKDLTEFENFSKLIGTNELIQLINKISNNLEIIIFLPSKFSKDINDINSQYRDFINPIKFISNKFDTYIYNILENLSIVQKFGLKLDEIQIFIKLPNRSKFNMFKYVSSITVDFQYEFIKWCQQMLEISGNFQSIDSNSFNNERDFFDKLPQEIQPSLSFDFTNFIYFYDPNSTFDEDFEILNHLLEPLSKLQNIKFEKNTNWELFKNKYWYEINSLNHKDINEDLHQQLELTFDEIQFEIQTSTSLPVLCKFNSILPIVEIYQNFGPNEIRDYFQIKDWINKQSEPLIGNFNEDWNKLYKTGENTLLIIQIIDEISSISNVLKSLKDYKYVLEKWKYWELIKRREEKDKELQDFKNSPNFNEIEYHQKSIREIYPINDEIKDVKTSFIFANNTEILNELGLNINSKKYQENDLLIVDLSNKFYYDSKIEINEPLTSFKPDDLTRVLLSLNNIAKEKEFPLLRNSPYSSKLRRLDNIHIFGIWGYLILIVKLIVVLYFIKNSTRYFHYISNLKIHELKFD
ncbi:hypothetical protein WICMUC_002541 [Wickerhamomyces mucosus]|uniref:Thioredoxin domain-containing protein n=1 Tax=Wickerhamomyces mucosus TaxID=1378264 RepID=A0A9P8PR10_9ASCO|nr:hypothetical protein WICMUC_002541 [Wickerhamomyces mucosus]